MATRGGATLGFIGLGTMGAPIAGHLVRAGHAVRGWDLAAAARATAAAHGVAEARSATDAAQGADALFLSLTGPQQVEDVLTGAGRALEALRPGALAVDLSTNSVEGTRRMAEACAKAGVAFVDAPVSGGKAGAEAGKLAVMVGASPAEFASAEPLLRVFAARVFHVGPSGHGTIAKLVNNQIFLSASVLVQEAFVFAAKAGVDASALLEILQASSAASVIGAARFFLARNFDDAVFKLAIAEKDLAVAIDSARALGVSVPATAAARGVYAEALDRGFGEKVFTATLRLLEARAGAEVPPLARRATDAG
jgi:3-hydroxyisobutyrate dehydrogenase-like beta-hydroxyacid dehydrogenase